MKTRGRRAPLQVHGKAGAGSPTARTCLACRKGIGEEEVGAEEFDEVLASLVTGGGEAGEDFPGAFAALGLVATGELPGDDRGAQGAFGGGAPFMRGRQRLVRTRSASDRPTSLGRQNPALALGVRTQGAIRRTCRRPVSFGMDRRSTVFASIELLLVMTIIALPIVIWLPSLGSAHRRVQPLQTPGGGLPLR